METMRWSTGTCVVPAPTTTRCPPEASVSTPLVGSVATSKPSALALSATWKSVPAVVTEYVCPRHWIEADSALDRAAGKSVSAAAAKRRIAAAGLEILVRELEDRRTQV